MMRCNYFEAQLLEYVYGLLDTEDSRELEDHLTQCGGCREALEKARRQQTQLAGAAKCEFPAVRFVAPPAIVMAPEEVRTLTAPPSSGWVRWSVAAGILLTAVALGLPAGLYSQQEDRVEEARARLQRLEASERTSQAHANQAQAELNSIESALRDLQLQRENEVRAVWQKASQQPLQMTITGPRSPDPGAANQYQIQVRDNRGQMPGSAQFTIKVRDEQGKVVHTVKQDAKQGNYRLVLPRDLPLKPNTQLALEVTAVADNGTRGTVSETLKLVAPVYLTHLTTDKPMYQPGETVHFRSLTLERFSLRPAQEDLELIYTIILPNGEVVPVLNALDSLADSKSKKIVRGPDGKPLRGLGAGDFVLDPSRNGGEFTLRLTEAKNRFLPQERKFIVNKYEKPRLNKELEFTRKSYGAGQEVSAACKVENVEGGKPVAKSGVRATVIIDGKSYGADGKEGAPFALQTDDLGRVSVKFQLPKTIDKGDASLSVNFVDAGAETIVRPIPIVLKKLHVEFFPEGGDLVAGVPNRVYFLARSTLGKPADLKGRIVDERGQVLTDVKTFNDPSHPGANQGMGRFLFTPLAGQQYRLLIDEPTGLEGKYALPASKPDGVVLNVEPGVTTDRDPISVDVRSSGVNRTLLVGAYCRGRLMAHETLSVRKGESAHVELRPESGIGGVYRVTVFEVLPGADNQPFLLPRAERLIYRQPAERLNLAVSTNKQRFVPGERIQLHCLATDEKGRPAPAILMVAVVDKSVLKLADEKTGKSLPTHFLLASEVRKPEDLEHADFLLNSMPSAHAALDLLLGTQGWRRFAEQDPGKFRDQHKNDRDADRLLVLNGQLLPELLTPQRTAPVIQKAEEVRAKYSEKFAPLQEKRLEREEHAAVETAAAQTRIEDDKSERANVQRELQAATTRLTTYRKVATVTKAVGLPVVGLLLLLVGMYLLVQGAMHLHTPLVGPYLASAACVLGLFCLMAIYMASYLGDSEKTQTVAQFMPVSGVVAAGGEAPVADGPGAWKKEANLPMDAAEAEFRQADAKPGAAPHDKAAAMKPRAPLALPAPGMGGRGVPIAEKAKFEAGKGDGKGEGKFAGAALLNLQGRQGAGPQKRAKLANQQQPAMNGLRDRRAADRKVPLQDGARRQLERMDDRFDRNKDMDHLRMANAFGVRGEQQLAAAAMAPALPPPPCLVREYAHQHTTESAGVRKDFTETLSWQPVLVLPDGKADTTFDLCDSVTTFQVLAAGHTLDGRLGAVTTAIESRLPLVLEPRLPIEVTASDRIDLPLSIANNSDTAFGVTVQANPTNLALLSGKHNQRLILDADQRTRRVYRFRPTIVEGQATIRFDGQSEGAPGDSIERMLKIVPDGFPVIAAQSDMLEKIALQELVLPESRIPGTLQVRVMVYPSTLATLQKGLEGILREPCGCFEQTSTSNYPNLLVLDYLKSTEQANPAVARRAQDLLERGYQKLVSFECRKQNNQREGYEWFGGTAPPHEALTAYGLMQFRDMARVYNVDEKMVDRTRDYLMSQRDGKGGFHKNPRALDTFGRAPDHITAAYIVWALTESGKQDDVAKELNVALETAKTSKDPYFIALVANSLLNRDRNAEAIDLLKGLSAKQNADGHLDAERTSITGSGGRDLQIETTSLTLMAWLKAKRPDLFNAPTQKAVDWIGKQRGGYGAFGSTQSTILALKALIAYSQANKKTAEAGTLVLFVNDKEAARQDFAAGTEDTITLDLKDAEKVLKSGKNAVRIELNTKTAYPYTLAWTYRALKPVSAEKCPVRLGTTLMRNSVSEGDTIRLTATVENVSGKGQGMALAIIGLPAGMTIPEDMKQLKDLARLRNEGTERGQIDFFEVRGRELILYWRDLAPGKKIEVPIDLIARVPGVYRGPASRAYLYYNADHKHWVDPLQVTIEPKTEK